MASNEGVALASGLYDPEDLDLTSLDGYSPKSEEFKGAVKDEFDRIIDKLGVISEAAKQKIIDTQLSSFPLSITTADIGLCNIQILWSKNGNMPHIDQQDRKHGATWLPPELYTGASISVPLRGDAEWRAWNTNEFALLDNMGTKHPLPIIRKASQAGQSNTEVVTNDSGLACVQTVGDIVIIRQGDVMHRVRQTGINSDPRIRVLGDITLIIDSNDLTESDVKEALEWAEEQRQKFLSQVIVHSAVRLKPAQ